MTRRRVDLVVAGRVVLAAGPRGLETAEAIGIADGRVVMAGTRAEVLDAAPGARVADGGRLAVIPGLHDFHIHLVALARARHAVALDEAGDQAGLTRRLAAAAADVPPGQWITGRGWSRAQLADGSLDALEAAVAGHPTYLDSHDGHSAWASAEARRAAGLTASTVDPPGGRIERDEHGEPTGILRETAMELVAPFVERLRGPALRAVVDETLRELASFGITGASEAGDYTDDGGVGADAPLGDSYSSLTDLADLVDGRLRVTLGIPADALDAAGERRLRTGAWLTDRRTMRFGWAKEYSDGALGSSTAALFAPPTCGAATDAGILRVEPEELDDLFERARGHGIGMAVHAIGDRAAATVLDAVTRARPRTSGVPADRVEHAQLVRAADRPRFAELGVTASIQPIHAAADRDMVEACWADRQADAYAWRSLVASGAHLAAGSDAPVEAVNPWLGIFAAVHRRLPADRRGDWRPDEAVTVEEALRAYTLGPALAVGAADEGHLRPGARADLAMLDVDLEVLLAADERLAQARSTLTLIDGVEVPAG